MIDLGGEEGGEVSMDDTIRYWVEYVISGRDLTLHVRKGLKTYLAIHHTSQSLVLGQLTRLYDHLETLEGRLGEDGVESFGAAPRRIPHHQNPQGP